MKGYDLLEYFSIESNKETNLLCVYVYVRVHALVIALTFMQ